MRTFSLRSALIFFGTLCFFTGMFKKANAQVNSIVISSSNQTVNPTTTYNPWLVTGLSNEMINNTVCIIPPTIPAPASINTGAFATALAAPVFPFNPANTVGNYTAGGITYTELSAYPNNVIYTPNLAPGTPTNLLPTMTVRRRFRICSNINENINFNFTVFCDDAVTNVSVDGVTVLLTGSTYPANAIAPKTVNQTLNLTPGLHWIEITGADLEDPAGQTTNINLAATGFPAPRKWNPFALGIDGSITATGGNLVLLNSDNGGSVSPITGPSTLCANSNTITLSDATTGGTWSSSNTSIATINPTTGIVSGVSPGSATITYTFGTGPCAGTATYDITVTVCHCEDPCSWSLTGNTTVYPYNFIGSINNADFKIRTNNTEKMIVTAGGNVGIGTSSPAQALDVNGQARIQSLPGASANERLVLANNSGDLHSLNTTGLAGDYLGGDGTWHTLIGGGGGGTVTDAAQGVTLSGTTVLLGDYCGRGRGQFESNREINMNDYNLYFNSDKAGKIYMGANSGDKDDCRKLQTRLEISSAGLPAVNDYVSPDPGVSGLRFTDLIPKNVTPIENRTGGVLSLDDDGDVIWVQACCGRKEQDAKLDAITARLDKMEAELKAAREQNAMLTQQLTKMDVILSQANTIVLNQNTPNPFSESTVITYSIPRNFGKAQMIFRTVTGEIIRTADIKTSGKGVITVYARDISKGLYTYTLIVDGQTIDTKKMIKQ